MEYEILNQANAPLGGVGLETLVTVRMKLTINPAVRKAAILGVRD